MGDPIRARVTWAEYQELPEDGHRYEVLEGELVMTPAPGYPHQCVSLNLSFLLETWRRRSGAGGKVLTAPFDVILSEDTIVQPDLVYIGPEKLALVVDGRLHGAPTLAVEIFGRRSAGRDRVVKLQVYARFEVAEYWLADLEARMVTMLALSGGSYQTIATGAGDVPLRSRCLGELSLTAREVFDGV